MGVAAHPYRYATDQDGYGRNYYHQYGITVQTPQGTITLYNGYSTGGCRDLGDMITLWSDKKYYHKHRLPLVFTEQNWSDLPTAPPDPKGRQFCSSPTGCEGTYLIDLFTWLYDKGYAAVNPSDKHSLRVAWYRGADGGGLVLGIFSPNGREKKLPLPLLACPNAHIAPLYISGAYKLLRSNHCY